MLIMTQHQYETHFSMLCNMIYPILGTQSSCIAQIDPLWHQKQSRSVVTLNLSGNGELFGKYSEIWINISEYIENHLFFGTKFCAIITSQLALTIYMFTVVTSDALPRAESEGDNCLPLLNAGSNPISLEPNLQQTVCPLTNRLS